MFLGNMQAKKQNPVLCGLNKKAYAGHIRPAGRMLCMSALDGPEFEFHSYEVVGEIWNQNAQNK